MTRTPQSPFNTPRYLLTRLVLARRSSKTTRLLSNTPTPVPTHTSTHFQTVKSRQKSTYDRFFPAYRKRSSTAIPSAYLDATQLKLRPHLISLASLEPTNFPRKMVKLFAREEDRPTPKAIYNWRVYSCAIVAATAAIMIGLVHISIRISAH